MRSWHGVWVAAAVGLFVFGGMGAIEAGVVRAVTQQGAAVDLDILQYGRVTVIALGAAETLGEDSTGGKVQRTEGARLRFQSTAQVPLTLGEGFGFRVKIPPIPPGDKLAIDVVVTLPSVSIDMTVDRSEVRGRLVYEQKNAGETRNITWTFSGDNSRYHKTGNWTLSLYNADKLLVTRPFEVVAGSANPQ